MDNLFPEIKNIDQVIDAVKDREEIIVAERPHFTVIDYMVALTDTFPDPKTANDEEEALRFRIRRECRGIKFHPKTGDIMARPYHKFFNLGEKDETQHNNISWNEPFVILEKLDGSMNHPIITDDGKIHMCTRMGMTDVAAQADAFIERSPIDYVTFCTDMLMCGMTPIFEWCSKKQRIVILYKEDNLVLTGIRYNYSGNYMHHERMYKIAEEYGLPVVNKWEGSFDGIEKFMEENSAKQNEEGNVIRFDSGSMMKHKNDWYCQIHKAKDQIRFEKDVIRLYLEGNLDDVIPHVLPEDEKRLRAYTQDLTAGIEKTVNYIHLTIADLKDRHVELEGRESRAAMAKEIVKSYNEPLRALMFDALNGHNVMERVVYRVLDKTHSSTQVDSVRPLFGIDWDDY